MVRASALILAGFLLAGAAAPKKPAPPSQLAIAIRTVRAELDRQLPDYPSARFRDVTARLSPDGTGVAFCGWINAKNRFGGYVGWQPFSALAGDRATITVANESPELVKIMCVTSVSGTPIPGDQSTALTYSQPRGEK